MLTVEQIKLLNDNKEYKKTKCLIYNWKESKGIVASPDFSMEDFSIDGKKWSQITFIHKIAVWMFKRVIIANEIGEYRNIVVERLLDNSQSDDLNICGLIGPGMKWVAPEYKKIEQVKNIVSRFITDPNIKRIIFQTVDMNSEAERLQFVNALTEKIKKMFFVAEHHILDTTRLSSQFDYEFYLQAFGNEHCTELLREFSAGNLATIQRKEGTKK